MKLSVWFWTAAALVSVMFFASGFIVGRHFPIHHFERLADVSAYMLFDTATGKPCMVHRVGVSVPITAPKSDNVFKGLPGYDTSTEFKDSYPDVPTCGTSK